MIKKEDFVNKLDGSSSVRYFLYRDNKPYQKTRITYPDVIFKSPVTSLHSLNYTKHGFVVNNNTACFASLPGQLCIHPTEKFDKDEQAKDYERIIYYPTISPAIKDEHLTKWIVQAKKYGLLPQYCNVADVLKTRAFVFDINAHNLHMLFTYLCMARFLAADPSYILNVLTLNTKYKINFLVALVVFSYTDVPNMLHHFLPIDKPYPSPKHALDCTKIDLGVVIGLYRFLKSNGVEVAEKHGYRKYNVNGNITKLYGVKHFILPSKLKSSYIPRIIKADNATIDLLIKKGKIA